MNLAETLAATNNVLLDGSRKKLGLFKSLDYRFPSFATFQWVTFSL